jgi:dTDP-4-amino-4,6-dideoxygalactose transaminase
LDKWTASRQHNAQIYRDLFGATDIVIDYDTFRDGAQGIVLPQEISDGRHIYNQFIIRCQHRDDLRQYLKEHHIASEIYYPWPLHLQECFADLGYKPNDLPHSEQAANESLALPIYPELGVHAQERVVETIVQFYKQY